MKTFTHIVIVFCTVSHVFMFIPSISQAVYTKGMITGNNCNEPALWDEIIHDMQGHPLQLWGWGEVKSAHNWSAHRVLFVDENDVVEGAAQVLVRALPGPFRRLCYVPRGPVWQQGSETAVLDALVAYVRQHLPGVVLTVEPDHEFVEQPQGWRQSANTILLPRTLILDLSKGLDELQSAMAKKTRQYIRKSSNEQLEFRRVRTGDEMAACLAIYHQTAERAGFALHSDQYYHDVHDKLGDSSVIFGAFDAGQLVSFVWLAVSSHTAFELYGGMNDQGQQLRANYGLKWHAITACKEWGIERYDMNGLLNDGVSTFKQGFASHENTLIGTLDYPLSPLYAVWSRALPAVKRTVRRAKSLVAKN